MAINYLLIMTKANSGYWANMVCFFINFTTYSVNNGHKMHWDSNNSLGLYSAPCFPEKVIIVAQTLVFKSNRK